MLLAGSSATCEEKQTNEYFIKDFSPVLMQILFSFFSVFCDARIDCLVFFPAIVKLNGNVMKLADKTSSRRTLALIHN